MKTGLYIASALTAAVTLAACGGTAKIASTTSEKCYGVAQAGKNDCASGAHACKGQSLAMRSSGDFVYLPLGTCDKLTGGSLKG